MQRPVMPVIDSHCHAWHRWPYRPPVPDPEQRGRVEQLLHEMNGHDVDQAVLVSAQIEHNPENNVYVADAVARYPDRLHQFADLDSVWSATYHTPGSGDRLRRLAEKWPLKGFTHYLSRDEDGTWLISDQGSELFRAAADHRLIASLSCYPHQQAAIRLVAERFPEVPVLCHHLGHARANELPPYAELGQILASARVPNIYIKLSGFAYAASVKWEYPYAEVQPIVRAEYDAYGPHRMCWGSDYPVVRFFMTYRQALEAFRGHCAFVPDADKGWILGGTLAQLLSAAGTSRAGAGTG